MSDYTKGIEAERALRQNETNAKSIEDQLVKMFYGGHHPNSTTIHDLVEVLAETEEYRITDPLRKDAIIARIMKRF